MQYYVKQWEVLYKKLYSMSNYIKLNGIVCSHTENIWNIVFASLVVIGIITLNN